MCYFTIVKVLSLSSSHLIDATTLWHKQRQYYGTFYQVIWSWEVKWLLCGWIIVFHSRILGGVSWEVRQILPSCFAWHLVSKWGQEAGMGKVKTVGRCWCSGPWTPHPLTLSHWPSPWVDWFHIRSCLLTPSGLLLTHLPITMECCASRLELLDSCDANLSDTFHAGTPAATGLCCLLGLVTWHLRKQRCFSRATTVTKQSFYVHTPSAVRFSVRLWF